MFQHHEKFLPGANTPLNVIENELEATVSAEGANEDIEPEIDSVEGADVDGSKETASENAPTRGGKIWSSGGQKYDKETVLLPNRFFILVSYSVASLENETEDEARMNNDCLRAVRRRHLLATVSTIPVAPSSQQPALKPSDAVVINTRATADKHLSQQELESCIDEDGVHEHSP